MYNTQEFNPNKRSNFGMGFGAKPQYNTMGFNMGAGVDNSTFKPGMGFGGGMPKIGMTQPGMASPMPQMQMPGQGSTAPVYFTPTNPNIQTKPVTPYKSNIDPKNPMSSLIQKMGGMLTPQDAFGNKMSYETYASPQRAVFDQWTQNTFRPEFERFTLNPFKTQYSTNAAAGNMGMLGGAKKMYQTALTQTEQPYYNDLENAKNSYEDMIMQGYQKQMQNYYNSPTAFNNLGRK